MCDLMSYRDLWWFKLATACIYIVVALQNFWMYRTHGGFVEFVRDCSTFSRIS